MRVQRAPAKRITPRAVIWRGRTWTTGGVARRRSQLWVSVCEESMTRGITGGTIGVLVSV